MNRITDSMLLERLPDDDAMRELYARYSRLVYSTALGVLRRPDLAEDATQSVFLILLAKARELECVGSLAPWLYVATVRAARGIAKSEHARKRREQASVLRTVTKRQEPSDLIAAIGRLAKLDREVLLLRHVQGMSLEEVGSELGLSEDAARMRLKRAQDKLRRRLGEAYGALLGTAFRHEPQRPWSPPHTSQPVGISASKGIIAMQSFLKLISAGAFAACLFVMFRLGNADGSHIPIGPAPKGVPFVFKTPTGPYRLTYTYTESSPNGKPTNGTHTLTVTEAQGALMIQSSDPKWTSSVVYANGRTLGIRVPKDTSGYDPGTTGVSYGDGFASGEGVTALRLPFNFRAAPMYRPLQEDLDNLDRDKHSDPKVIDTIRRAIKNSPSNLALLANPGVDRQGLVEGTYMPKGAGATLLVGSNPRKWSEFRYSGMRQRMGVPVPETITMTEYDFPNNQASWTVPKTVYTLRLQSLETNAARIAKPTPEALLMKHQWITYHGYGRKSVGIMFDPDEPLDQQVRQELADQRGR